MMWVNLLILMVIRWWHSRFFSESNSAPRALPFSSSQGSVRKKQQAEDLRFECQASSRRLNARVPHRHRRGREHSPILFTQHDQRHSAVSDMISFGGSDGEIDDSLFFWRLRTRRSYWALWLTPPSYRCPLHVTPDSEWMRSSSASWQRLSMSSGSNGLRWGAISQKAGQVFFTGRYQAPRQRSYPFLPKVNDELMILWHAPHSSRICPSASAALTSVDGTEEKGYKRLPPLDESVAAHLCPPTANGWKARASHPSKLCICTCWMRLLGGWTSSFGATLYGCASGLPGQDAHHWGSRSGCSFTQGPEERNEPGPAHH